MPYALMRGGWLALAALLLIMPLFALSGQVCKLGWHCFVLQSDGCTYGRRARCCSAHKVPAPPLCPAADCMGV